MTKLQVAIDLLTTEAALEVAHKVAPYVDIIELGTPLIKAEGIQVVTAMKTAFPDKLIFADMKIADTGFLEAEIAFKAGADLVTVMGAVDDATVKGAVEAAAKYGRKVVVDTIGAKEVTAFGVAFVELHAGLDEQALPGYSVQTLISEGRLAKVPFSVAGGVNIDTIKDVVAAGADVAVAGGAIYGAEDPAAAAKALKEAINSVTVA
jgi:3-hexulose-6-phosphate synthase